MRYKALSAAVALALGVSVLAACGTQNSATASREAAPETSATPTPTGKVGVSAAFDEIYDLDSLTTNTAAAPYDKLDILYIAFAHINTATMKLDFEDVRDGGRAGEKVRLQNILDLTKSLREAGKLKLVISLGYGGNPGDIGYIEQNLDTFAPSVPEFLKENSLNGFDIDYELPTFSSNAQFKRVSTAIRTALGPEYLFTITPDSTRNLDGPTLNQNFDYVNAQSYRASGTRRFQLASLLPPRMTGLDPSKITAGSDTDDGDRIADAVAMYNRYNLGGLFAWQLRPNFNTIANDMWAATHPGS